MNLFDGKRALVLGGGSARGLAHIGFIKTLEKYGIEYDMIVGTSMGALIGAIYLQRENIEVVEQLAKDIISKQFARIVGFEKKENKKRLKIVNEIFDSLNKLFKYAKLIKNEGYLEQKHIDILMEQILLDVSVNQFRLPFATVAVDLISGKTHIFRDDNSKIAVKSSIAIPGAITPVKYKNMLLVDGGVSSIVPVKEAKSIGAKRIVAFDVSRKGDAKEKFENAIDVMFRVDGIRGELLKQYQLSQADKVIRLGHYEIESNEYSQIDKLISIGEELAEENIKEIKEIFSAGMIKRVFSSAKRAAAGTLFASLDFGSSTIIVSVYEKDSSECVKEEIIHHDLMFETDKGILKEEGINKLKKYILFVKNTLNKMKVDSYKIIGTAQFRGLKNILEIQRLFISILGKPMMILSPGDEARLTFLGNTFGRDLKDGSIAVLDVGGGSTEFIIQISPIRKYIENIPIGSKRLMMVCEKENLHTEEEIRKKAREYLKYYGNTRNLKLIISGGTITTIAGTFQKMEKYDKKNIDNMIIQREEIDRYISKYAGKNTEEIKTSLNYDKERASHIVFGLIIISEIMHMYNVDDLTISTDGIRRGMFLFSNRPTYL